MVCPAGVNLAAATLGAGTSGIGAAAVGAGAALGRHACKLRKERKCKREVPRSLELSYV